MRSFSNRGSFRTGLFLVLTIIAICLVGLSPVKAVQKNAADTVSTSGVEFTTIPTAADSLAAFKKKQAALKKANPVIKSVAVEKPKSLWEIFIAGLIGGFTAVILPCIYPLLPLTVSFFTKKSGSRAKGVMQSMIYGVSIIAGCFRYIIFRRV